MKTALITGASGGIGRATAETFIKNGYFTVCHYNSDASSVKDFKAELEKQGLSDYAYFFKADFNDYSEIEKLYRAAEKQFGHIDMLVNNAGVDLYKQIGDVTEKEYDRVMNVNLKSAYFLSALLLNKMIERKKGNIIFLSSVWGNVGASMETLYSASKAALIGLTKSLAKEVAPCGIRVNAVCPGFVDTKMNDCFSLSEKAEIIDNIPLSRSCSPQEVAELIYYLSSEKASYVTGQAITFDGGFTL